MGIRAAVSKLFSEGPDCGSRVRRAQTCFMGPHGGEMEAKPLAPLEQSKDVIYMSSHIRFSEQMGSVAENKFEKQQFRMGFFLTLL